MERPRRAEISSWPAADVPPTVRTQIVDLREQAWPSHEGGGRGVVHDPALRPLTVALSVEGVVVAALDFLSKNIDHAGQRYAASGLSAVATDGDYQHQGYGSSLVRAAGALMARAGADLGIFTCDPPLRAFYEGAGWDVLPGSVLIGGTPDEPFPSDQFGKLVLGWFFSPRAKANAHRFVAAHIGLYPGTIDKLW
jgi:aminoglycoside 2'-N-acetyltransferase I